MTRNGMRPIHPGEVLREEFLAPLKMTAHALAMALRVPSPRIHEIIRERRAVSPDTALRFSRHFQTSPEFCQRVIYNKLRAALPIPSADIGC